MSTLKFHRWSIAIALKMGVICFLIFLSWKYEGQRKKTREEKAYWENQNDLLYQDLMLLADNPQGIQEWKKREEAAHHMTRNQFEQGLVRLGQKHQMIALEIVYETCCEDPSSVKRSHVTLKFLALTDQNALDFMSDIWEEHRFFFEFRSCSLRAVPPFSTQDISSSLKKGTCVFETILPQFQTL